MTRLPDEIEAGLRLLERGEFWQAHEAWEQRWRALPAGSAAREATQALIQIAAACYKLVQGAQRSEAGMQRGMEALLRSARGHNDAAADAGEPPPAWATPPLDEALDRLTIVLRRWRDGIGREVCLEEVAAVARQLAARLREG